MDQVFFEDVREGEMIPELQKSPSTQQLVHWAAGSGDFYQIHYDKDFAIGTGLDGVIVHGALKHAFLGDLVHRWIAPAGRIKRLSCAYRGMDIPTKLFKLKARVNRKYQESGNNCVELEVWGENEDGQSTTPGNAIVSLPSRES
jgi:hypothetical protein